MASEIGGAYAGGMDSCSVPNMNFHRVHTQWGKNYSCNMFIIPWISAPAKITPDADAFLCVWTIQDPKNYVSHGAKYFIFYDIWYSYKCYFNASKAWVKINPRHLQTHGRNKTHPTGQPWSHLRAAQIRALARGPVLVNGWGWGLGVGGGRFF